MKDILWRVLRDEGAFSDVDFTSKLRPCRLEDHSRFAHSLRLRPFRDADGLRPRVHGESLAVLITRFSAGSNEAAVLATYWLRTCYLPTTCHLLAIYWPF